MKRGVLVLALALLACDRPAGESGIDRETFVATYVDLRRATVDGRLDDATRDSILDAHGTTADELRAFVTARADDPEAIADAWRDIHETLTAPPDSVLADSTDADSTDTDSDDADSADAADRASADSADDSR